LNLVAPKAGAKNELLFDKLATGTCGRIRTLDLRIMS
jgi:hypothetical protein